MPLYEIALMGVPSDSQQLELEQQLSSMIKPFGLHLGVEVAWSICPSDFNPRQTTAAAVAFFGGIDVQEENLSDLLRKGTPILPIASAFGRVHEEIPTSLKPFNCMAYSVDGPTRICTALLECAGLLPRQRRVFVSYRRNEARGAALQLFDALSARLFDVFLDTHGIAPAEDFQAILWHRLCDSDVLVMLDTPNYFESRWTTAEFGRALAKEISVLRVGWPDCTPNRRTETASRVDLASDEVDNNTGHLSDNAIQRICVQLEAVRSQSHAVRSLNLFSKLQMGVERIGGTVLGVGPHRAVHISLPDGREVVAYPTVGVPTSMTLHEATKHAPDASIAVVYDHVGLDPNWQAHLSWLGNHIHTARWVKADEAAWCFADWEG